MDRNAIWILSYAGIYFLSLFIFPNTSRVLSMAFLIALLLNYPSRFFQKKTLKRLTVVMVSLGLVVLFAYLFYTFPSMISMSVDQFKESFNKLIIDNPLESIMADLPDFIQGSINDFFGNFGSLMSNVLVSIVTYISTHIANWITFVVLLIVAAIYILSRGKNVDRIIPKLFPKCNTKKIMEFWKGFLDDLETYIGGQLIVALCIGVFIGISTAIFGIQGSYFLGLLAGITNLIPFLGVIITAIPMMVFGYTSRGLLGVGIALIILVAANQMEMWFLSPKIVSNQLKFNWFVVLIALLAFSELFGAFGIILTVPTIVFIRRFWNMFVLKD
ncbi:MULTISPECIES: AI-2E family transporter [Kosmotoga]|jgi:predicted PurR-regulated permease PerM|uniref:Permease n=1 Tax=Kosmotoga olearia (strain ATCC BAA-1733 / DSM 21960 / TBF 19.5.1) TaxID=521045 RepID=C5CDM9_KOSOT|nr:MULTISPECIES: AI-2E family transporter [Kosmotoga]ACR80041.1 protein of unknown function UPF0118 [Kosmotoga olearia TBF 19.5.1]MDI3524413.1 hypothetical protein [Kosmotoga sp.]OAA20480.1 hypothetical protein DU53_07425 [Kosmotoga sp. DU53]